MTPAFLLALSLAACSGDDDDDDDDDNDSAADSGDTDDEVDDGVSPTITGADEPECGYTTDGYDYWVVTAYATDPQGNNTLGIGEMTVLDLEDEVVGTQGVACSTDGTCTASIVSRPDTFEFACDAKGTFRLVAVDQQGNRSAAYDVPVNR